MAIDDLPLPVVNFLNVIGVPWPYVNEDTVSQFASLVREFGQAVETTHRRTWLVSRKRTSRLRRRRWPTGGRSCRTGT